MRAPLVILFTLLLIGFAISMVPLKTAVEALHLDRSGLVTRDIDGTLWAGHLYDARLGAATLGDVTTSMTLAGLFRGRVRLDAEGSDPISRFGASFSHGLGGPAIEGLNIVMPAARGVPMLPAATIEIEGLSARFHASACAAASGTAQVYLPEGKNAAMSGTVLCRGGKLTIDLASGSGNERQSITFLSAKRYRIVAMVRSANAGVAARLEAAGFVAGPGGFRYEAERAL